MAVSSLLRKASRLFAFARHMPLRKLARRVELNMRRRAGDRFGRRPAVPLVGLGRAAAPPAPLFPPRSGMLGVEEGGLRFSFIGRTLHMPSGEIRWDMPSRAPADQLWRMHLHYLEFLEDAPLDLWQRLVSGWIADNPQSRPGVWRDSWNSYALSLRVVVLMQEMQRRRDSLPETVRAMVEDSVVEQLLFLERNLETDLGGNHLIKNIKALIWGSAYFTGPDAQRWRGTGLRLLAQELGRQILPDGVHYERSASYHAQVFADLMECRHALGADGAPGGLDDALAGMARATADLTHPDGGPVLFNDAGLSMAYAPGACLDAYRALTGHAPVARSVFAFPDAGYFGARQDGHALIADCGRIAPDDLPAHGHGDVLAFEWSVGGKRMIVDQGVFQYFEGERRQRSRSAASHNTLCMDGADQADFFGSFRCGRRPAVQVRHYAATPDGFVLEGSHDGFRHLAGAPVAVRRFEVDSHGVTIRDWLEGAPERGARIGLLLHPDVSVELAGREARLVREGQQAVIRANKPFAMERAVWWCDLGRERPTRRLFIRHETGDSITEVYLGLQ